VTIEFTCDCGARCSADESQVGQLFHCEACGLDIPVPSPQDAAKADEGAAERPEPAPTDVAHAAVEDMEDAQAHAEAERAMVEQMKDVRGDADQIAATRREALEALRRETAGDLDEAEAKAKHEGDVRALHEQLGAQGGLAEIAEQLRPSSEGGEAVTVSAGELGPRVVRPLKKKPPTGAERAAHHIGFKRAIWLPSLIVGLVCVAFGVLACAGINLYSLLHGSEENPYKRHVAYFQEQLKKAGIDEFDVIEVGRASWAIPKGATHSVSQTGIVYFQNRAAYGDLAPDEPAVDATDYVKARDYKSGRGSGFTRYGIALLAVGAVLIAMSIITLRDVRLVAGARPGAEEEAAEKEAAEEETAQEDAAEAEAAEAEGEPSDQEPPPQDQGEIADDETTDGATSEESTTDDADSTDEG